MGFVKGSYSPPPVQGRASDPGGLGVLENTRVGKMPGLALLGVEEEESDLEEIEMWLGEEDELGRKGEEGGPRPP